MLQVIIALGGSLMSGADSAANVRYVIRDQRGKQYTKIEGRTYGIGNFSEAIAGLLGGLLATSSLLLPIQIQTCYFIFMYPNELLV